MKVIFLQDVKGQGKKDDIKDMSDGYVRNYLLPNGLVKIATDNNIKHLDIKLKNEQTEQNIEKSQVQLLKSKIEELNLDFKLKVIGNKATGIITDIAIIEKLKTDYKIDIDKRKIKNHESINKLGIFYITIKLDFGIEAKLKIEVTKA